MIGKMQRLHSTQDSGITLCDLPAKSESGKDTAHEIRTQDEIVITLAALSKHVPEEQVDSASAPRINVDAQTVFAITSDLPRRRKIYIAGSVVVLVATAIVIPMLYFTHLVSSAAGVTPPAAITRPATEDITRQINVALDGGNDETTGLTSTVISATAEEEHAGNAAEDSLIPGQTDDGKSGQHEEVSSISVEDIVPAEITGETTSELSSPLATSAHMLAPDTDAAVIMGYATESDTKEIRIIRGRVLDQTGALINAAYTAYVTGNYSDARQAYLGVLKGMPDHRAALLGMAAIALRTGDTDEAGRIWLQVLADYPDDPVATAALIDLMAAQDHTGSTRAIGKLLQDYPHAAFLYFSLGNLQAAASRWPEARQAFAEACRLEGDNPDYVYNLAVSLEHAGDSRTALDYYKTALELAHDRPVHFDNSVVMARITVLSETSHGR